ncbi:amino acid permease/ SLC12A domain-containing protein [Melampsora americana]|nr:amino acid permease/ SLC12A domain-containing protein [Melampsora americana]
MKSRHIQMISIGSVVGMGLFLSTANALRESGPLGLLLSYAVMGTMVFGVMDSLGEMVSHLPIAGGHVTLAKRFVNPSLSFALGWNFWYTWFLVFEMTELAAAGILINYWITSISNAVWILVILAAVTCINFAPSRIYGDKILRFASIKVVTIITLIIIGLVIDLGGGPNHHRIGFQFWKNPGPFVQFLGISGVKGRFLGFWQALIQAGFSCVGTEITAMTAGEAKNPRKTLPSAIRKVAVRIWLFYILGTFVIGLIVSSDDPRLNLNSHNAASSPFVIAIQDSGIKVLPSIINAALLTAACSAASSDMYTTSRTLHGLALAENAPAALKQLNSHGIPWICVLISSAMGLLSLMSVGGGGIGQLFTWLATMVSVTGLQTWVGILITYLRWDLGVRAQSIDRSMFPYQSRLRRWGAYYVLTLCIMILISNPFTVLINGQWSTATLVTGYLPIVMFVILYLSNKLFKQKKGQSIQMIKPADMDFDTGVRESLRDLDD